MGMYNNYNMAMCAKICHIKIFLLPFIPEQISDRKHFSVQFNVNCLLSME